MDVRIESDPQTLSLFRDPSTELFNELERKRKIRIISLTKKREECGRIHPQIFGRISFATDPSMVGRISICSCSAASRMNRIRMLRVVDLRNVGFAL